MINKTTNRGFSAIIVVIAVAVLAIAGTGVAYYLTDGFGQDPDGANPDNSSQSANNPAEAEPKSATGQASLVMLKAALDDGKSVTCTANYISNDKHFVVTMYVKDRDHVLQTIRSDMGQVNTLMLNQTDAYTWNQEASDRGTQTSITAQDLDIEGSWQNYIDDEGNDVDAVDRLKCERTDLADSLFEVPSDITFSKAS